MDDIGHTQWPLGRKYIEILQEVIHSLSTSQIVKLSDTELNPLHRASFPLRLQVEFNNEYQLVRNLSSGFTIDYHLTYKDAIVN